ncbi:MAG: N-acetylmuramoyl-L-alanine amidase, partial [Clostridia bacterium]|nr:N-acetylmuramoyl-L-alanine amidase [Clostridia bacterium]
TMKKRVFALLLAFAFVFALCLTGCKKKEEQASTPQTEEDLNNIFRNDMQKFEEESRQAALSNQTAQTTVPTAFSESIGVLNGRRILIDAGHGTADYALRERIAPGSNKTKAAFTAGAQGATLTEAQFNLAVAKKLEAKLKTMGVETYMTRTGANTTMSNIDRANMGNSIKADVVVKIHANSNADVNLKGLMVLVPGTEYVDEELAQKSRVIGETVHKHLLQQTGAADAGVVSRNDITGFNWSKVPVILVESGFMSNPEEDALLSSSEYQDKLVQGIADGLAEYFK